MTIQKKWPGNYGLFGYVTGAIQNVTVTGTIYNRSGEPHSAVGGIAGLVVGGHISNCAADLTLPGGRYACLYYRGSYRQLGARVAELFRWARKQGLSPTGDVLELYPIDDRFTAREEEFLTQLQVRVEPGAPLEAH